MQLDIFMINKRHQINSHHIIELILKQSPSLSQFGVLARRVLNNQWCDHGSKKQWDKHRTVGVTMKSRHNDKRLNMYGSTRRTDGWADTRSDHWVFKKKQLKKYKIVSLSGCLHCYVSEEQFQIIYLEPTACTKEGEYKIKSLQLAEQTVSLERLAYFLFFKEALMCPSVGIKSRTQ